MEEMQINYEDNSKHNSKWIIFLVGIFLMIIIITLICVIPRGSNWLTYENYLKIRTGMTYNQVVDVLDDHQGELNTSTSYEGYTMSIYVWQNSSGSKCIVVSFNNGEVSGKSQYGLS